MILELVNEKGALTRRDINALKIPCYNIGNNEEAAHLFNQLYKEARDTKWNTIMRTNSGGISKKKEYYRPPMWDVRMTAKGACIELTVVAQKMLRIQFRQKADIATSEEQPIYGHQAYGKFVMECWANGINLNNYALTKEQGLDAKKEIEPYMIQAIAARPNVEYDECHHLDFHNSFPAGLVNTHPEFKPIVNKFYLGRKTNPEYKAVLNYTIGYFQSEKINYRYASLSRDAINDNNARVRELAQRLRNSGRIILLYNTDGIWYKGKEYHGAGEGKELGQWENDHTNCKFRMKSPGAYEYIENEQYHPVVRGYTNLDKIKPRDQWQWGDIFLEVATPIQFFWKENEGITNNKGELL